jgi:hypothetical protein
MPRKTGFCLLFSLLASALLLEGCGAVSAKPAITTPIQNPTATPSPTPLPGGSDSLQLNMQQVAGRLNLPNGQITLDTVTNNGAGKLIVPNQSGTLVLQFCSFPSNLDLTGCLNIASFAQTSNPVNLDFVFPQKGTFAGWFQVLDNSGGQLYVSLIQGPIADPGVPYRSTLLPAASLTVPLGQTTGSASGGGSMSVIGLTAHIILKGATPNHTFSLAICNRVPCTAVANSSFTSDAQGNASADVALTQTDGMIFVVMDSDGAEFVTAFRVQ